MKIAIFSTRPYDRQFLDTANTAAGLPHELSYYEYRLDSQSAAAIRDVEAVCIFVNDNLDAEALRLLKSVGVRLVALRCAGFNNVDLRVAKTLDIAVGRVPAYSPHAVAEHTAALILSLNRHIHRAYNRVREGNFALDGLLGFDLAGKTIGIVGTGKIGVIVARIMAGFGCRILASDPVPSTVFEGNYVALPDLLEQSDIVTLHCPLTPRTRHLVDDDAIAKMKPGVMLINTSRGAVIDTKAVIRGLKNGKIGHLGLDVYEEESDLFFENLSGQIIHDDVFARLLTFPNVLITGHQAFFTDEALTAIANTTIANATWFECEGKVVYPVSVEMLA